MNTDLYHRVAEKVGLPALQLLAADVSTLSFLGGTPRCATEFEWPRKGGRPLGFVGQLDLAELDLERVAPWLPRAGRLLFFYDLDEWPWGFDPRDAGGWRVHHDTGTAPIRAVELPDDLKPENRLPRSKNVLGKLSASLPSLERVTLEEVGITEAEEDAYDELTLDAFGDNPQHQVGGYPAPVQGDAMEEECQLVSAGIDCGDPSGSRSAQTDALRSQPNDWRLLLQYDSDEDLDILWVDAGILYFWIRESDARRGDFEKVWVILQCC